MQKRLPAQSNGLYDYSFFNTIAPAEKEKAFEKFAVPESYKVSRELVLNSFSNIDFKRAHAPILFVGGGSDHIFPPGLTQSIAGRYKDNNSRVDVKIFEGKSFDRNGLSIRCCSNATVIVIYR